MHHIDDDFFFFPLPEFREVKIVAVFLPRSRRGRRPQAFFFYEKLLGFSSSSSSSSVSPLCVLLKNASFSPESFITCPRRRGDAVAEGKKAEVFLSCLIRGLASE